MNGGRAGYRKWNSVQDLVLFKARIQCLPLGVDRKIYLSIFEVKGIAVRIGYVTILQQQA